VALLARSRSNIRDCWDRRHMSPSFQVGDFVFKNVGRQAFKSPEKTAR
jgi:hypothetical protein